MIHSFVKKSFKWCENLVALKRLENIENKMAQNLRTQIYFEF